MPPTRVATTGRPQAQRLHERDREALEARRQHEDIAAGQHPSRIVAPPEQRHPRTEAELLLERADLGLERTLADQHEPRTRRPLQRRAPRRGAASDSPSANAGWRSSRRRRRPTRCRAQPAPTGARRAVPRQRFEVDAMAARPRSVTGGAPAASRAHSPIPRDRDRRAGPSRDRTRGSTVGSCRCGCGACTPAADRGRSVRSARRAMPATYGECTCTMSMLRARTSPSQAQGPPRIPLHAAHRDTRRSRRRPGLRGRARPSTAAGTPRRSGTADGRRRRHDPRRVVRRPPGPSPFNRCRTRSGGVTRTLWRIVWTSPRLRPMSAPSTRTLLQVVTSTNRRGAEVFAVSLGEALGRRGWEVRTIALAPGDIGERLDLPTLGAPTAGPQHRACPARRGPGRRDRRRTRLAHPPRVRARHARHRCPVRVPQHRRSAVLGIHPPPPPPGGVGDAASAPRRRALAVGDRRARRALPHRSES